MRVCVGVCVGVCVCVRVCVCVCGLLDGHTESVCSVHDGGRLARN